MMLPDSLGIRERLGLLVVIPLTALVVAIVPLIADRIDEARSTGSVADTAMAIQEAGPVLTRLQTERLDSLAYLAVSGATATRLAVDTEDVKSSAVELRGRFGREVDGALSAIDALSGVRKAVEARSISAEEVYVAFAGVIDGLVSAFGSTSMVGPGGPGSPQLDLLDATLRAGEAISRSGAALVMTTTDRGTGLAHRAEVTASGKLYNDELTRHALPAQASLAASLLTSGATRRADDVIRRAARPPADAALVAEAANAADEQSQLWGLAQADIVREVTAATTAQSTVTRFEAVGFGLFASLIVALLVALGAWVHRSITRPLRRLTRAAGTVADLTQAELFRISDEENPEHRGPHLAAIDIGSQDDIGELAAAFNRVQASAALLLERQVVSRRNIASMFASAGRRAQKLVGRQLAVIDDLERNELNPELLTGLYRLDHISTRLRRYAYSLLVVAGDREQVLNGTPVALGNVVRSALGEIEGFREVTLGHVCDVRVVAPLVSDLTLLLAELLENATSFSPPASVVDVGAELRDGHCRVTVTDRGIGMSEDALHRENRRLVERERLDIAPTSVLGLFVVGRLARRHGLGVRLTATTGSEG
ncbi:nitrate- and nitrite sensing domain-containing protein, partial [Amycolatopsis sp. H20-H5]|uniref:nitrate- and nitrite sensing domain-containing protein n=1 Tax=Amycolatopsis sp. H20-H5 TaxID=3046309 RepID=UPI002DBCFCCE